MRVLFFGTSAFAVPALELLASSKHEIAVCVTQPDRPQGRGLQLKASPVKEAAERMKIPLIQPAKLIAQEFTQYATDIGVVAAYGQLIRKELLSVPKHGMLGIHPSLLPKYRGAAPVAWPLLNGDISTGVTIFRLDVRLDAGEIVMQKTIAIDPQEDVQALTQRLADMGAQETLATLSAIESKAAVFTPQDDSQATIAPKLTKEQGRVKWQDSAESIHRRVRALSAWPGVTAAWRNNPIKLWKTSLGPAHPTDNTQAPGRIQKADAQGLWISTGEGTLILHELQIAGKRRMSVQEFKTGYNIRAGELFQDHA